MLGVLANGHVFPYTEVEANALYIRIDQLVTKEGC